MAFSKTLARRLFETLIPHNPLRKFLSHPDPGEAGFFRRFLQKRGIFRSAMPPENHLGLPVGERLIERLRILNGDRLRLEGLSCPNPVRAERMSVEEARKLFRVSQMQAVRETLRGISSSKSCISYSDFVEICRNSYQGLRSEDEILGLAKMIDESGAVLVFREMVFLRPEQVVKAMERAIPETRMELAAEEEEVSGREELKKMEKEKSEIEERARILVRRELWAGLCFFVIQTGGFMRLTFWELSWDVMEPICFYLTSIYFMAGYAFFLRTSKDPSFEGFFDCRFRTKKRKLMKINHFDIDKFNYLRRAFDPLKKFSSSSSNPPFSSRRNLVASSPHFKAKII